MKALQTYDYVVLTKDLHLIRLYSREKEDILDAMEKSMFTREDSGEFLIRSEDDENFNLRMFAKPEEGLSTIEACCPSEVSQVMKTHIDDIVKDLKDVTLDEIFDLGIAHFVNCKIERRIVHRD